MFFVLFHVCHTWTVNDAISVRQCWFWCLARYSNYLCASFEYSYFLSLIYSLSFFSMFSELLAAHFLHLIFPLSPGYSKPWLVSYVSLHFRSVTICVTIPSMSGQDIGVSLGIFLYLIFPVDDGDRIRVTHPTTLTSSTPYPLPSAPSDEKEGFRLFLIIQRGDNI